MKKIKEIILHIGFPKAGSTAVQEYCHKNRGVLLKELSFKYSEQRWHPEFGSIFCTEPNLFVYNAHMGLSCEEIKLRDSIYFDNIVDSFECCNNIKYFVFSYEGLSSLDKNAFSRMRSFCLRYAESVRVIAYVRAPLSYAVSEMSQRVKSGLEAFPVNCPPVFPHKTYLTNLLSSFNRKEIILKKFSDHSLLAGDIVKDFIYEVTGKEIQREKKPAKSNEKLSYEGLIYGEYLADAVRKKIPTYTLTVDYFSKNFGHYLSMIEGHSIKLSEERLNIVIEKSREHVDLLANVFGISFEEKKDDYLFRQNYDDSFFKILRSIANIQAEIFFNNHIKPF
jgi:hypothetical protein